jgi:hypothetical protein
MAPIRPLVGLQKQSWISNLNVTSERKKHEQVMLTANIYPAEITQGSGPNHVYIVVSRGFVPQQRRIPFTGPRNYIDAALEPTAIYFTCYRVMQEMDCDPIVGTL